MEKRNTQELEAQHIDELLSNMEPEMRAKLETMADSVDMDALLADDANVDEKVKEALAEIQGNSETEASENIAEAAAETSEAEKPADAAETGKEKNAKEKKKKAPGRFKRGLNALAKNRRRAGFATIAILVSMTAVGWGLDSLDDLHPYEINVKEKTLCYVKTEKEASDVVSTVFSDYAKEGTNVRAVSTGNIFTVQKSKKWRVPTDEMKSVEEASAILKEATADESEEFDVTIASTKTEVTEYYPEPKYKKGKDMLAGETKITYKGKVGSQRVTTTYITVNGEDKGKEITAVEILDKGDPAKVTKGILGLPDGADWRTYDGDPVCKDGDDLVTTAAYYQGKVPYKWGGRSLKTGVSCLGLVKEIYKKYGIDLPMSHSGMQHSGTGVSYKNAKPGDIICYKDHVGIYAGNGYMIDATHGSGVSKRKVNPKRVVTVRRIVTR